MIEFEFHISPVAASSRPQTGVGTSGSSSRTGIPISASVVRRTGLSTAAAMSGIVPSRQQRTS